MAEALLEADATAQATLAEAATVMGTQAAVPTEAEAAIVAAAVEARQGVDARAEAALVAVPMAKALLEADATAQAPLQLARMVREKQAPLTKRVVAARLAMAKMVEALTVGASRGSGVTVAVSQDVVPTEVARVVVTMKKAMAQSLQMRGTAQPPDRYPTVEAADRTQPR